MTPRPIPVITNDDELARAIEEFYPLAAAIEHSDVEPDAYVLGLRDAIDAYERRAGHAPAPPQTVAGLLEVEMFKRKLRQRGLAELLEVPETRLSEILRGKRAMNLDFARRLHKRLGVPADVVLNLQEAA
jgi:antitoxin component HigA of HigAB toxin-antitoxin module